MARKFNRESRLCFLREKANTQSDEQNLLFLELNLVFTSCLRPAQNVSATHKLRITASDDTFLTELHWELQNAWHLSCWPDRSLHSEEA